MWNERDPDIEKDKERCEEISKKVKANLEKYNSVDYGNGYLTLKRNDLGNYGLHSRGYRMEK